MIEGPVKVSGGEVRLTAVSMGNPHGVLFGDNFNDGIVASLGRELETHPIWPEKANIEFVRVDSADTLSMRARPLAYYGKAHRRQPSYRPRCGHGAYSYDRPGSHCLFRYLLPFQIGSQIAEAVHHMIS